MWADWPSLQPSADHAPDDPLRPGRAQARALDEQIALANALGLRVLLMPYRFPRWANGTEDLARGPRGKGARSTGCPPAPTGRTARGRGSSPSCTTATTRAARRARGSPASSSSTSPTCSCGRSRGRARGRGAAEDRAGHLGPQRPLDDALRALDQRRRRAASERYTRWSEFVPALLDELAAIGYLPHSGQAWSHHNYTDVERRRRATRSQAIRRAAEGALGRPRGGRGADRLHHGGRRAAVADAATCTPARTRARRRRAACATPGRCTSAADGAGAGVAMFAQYLLYADPNFDCGLLDPCPEHGETPGLEAWRAFPVYS